MPFFGLGGGNCTEWGGFNLHTCSAIIRCPSQWELKMQDRFVILAITKVTSSSGAGRKQCNSSHMKSWEQRAGRNADKTKQRSWPNCGRPHGVSNRYKGSDRLHETSELINWSLCHSVVYLPRPYTEIDQGPLATNRRLNLAIVQGTVWDSPFPPTDPPLACFSLSLFSTLLFTSRHFQLSIRKIDYQTGIKPPTFSGTG